MRIAVVSPFVDRQHGTERALAELLLLLIRKHGCEVWLYAQRVDAAIITEAAAASSANPAGRLVWRRIPSLPGPHLFQFLAWLLLNAFWRAWDVRARGEHFDLVFSPGINCFDAEVLLVHAVFRRLAELQRQPADRGLPQSGTLRRIHRGIYYALLQFLEKHIYSRPEIALVAVSQQTARQLEEYYGRRDVPVAWNGVDTSVFNGAARLAGRQKERSEMEFAAGDCVFLLIGNDWGNKGLAALLQAVASCRDLSLRLLVVGDDDPAPYRALAMRLGIADRITFMSSTENILACYAAADAYMAPSLEDSFNLPALEAMASGLPVAVSVRAGLSGALRDGEDALLIHQPESAAEIGAILRKLATDPVERDRLGSAAARTAQSMSWERHGAQIYALLQDIAARRARRGGGS